MRYEWDELYVPNGENQLFVKRLIPQERQGTILCLPGVLESGRIFYSTAGKGLGPFLAENGFELFVVDFRGQGKSLPKISRSSQFGHMDIIKEDFSLYFAELERRRPGEKYHCIAHSWGGVLLAAALGRFPDLATKISSIAFVGTKRIVRVRNLWRFLAIDLGWSLFAPAIARLCGYLPSRVTGFGDEPETRRALLDCIHWARTDEWHDTSDQLNYGQCVRRMQFPPLLSITGAKDLYLGHASDVNAFVQEIGSPTAKFRVLGKTFGQAHDYGHIDILTHRDARHDTFPMILEWLNSHKPLQA